MSGGLFLEISLVIISAGVLSLIARLFRQPLIIAYILTGLLVGPSLLGLATEVELFKVLSEIGIAFLLFLVGLHLNWKNIKELGRISVFAGAGQVLFTTGVGYLASIAFGFDPITALVIAFSFAFSSTIIIVKLLSDKEDIERFYGRLAIGMLIIQDIIAMLALVFVSVLGGQEASFASAILVVGLKIIAIIFGLWLITKYILPHVFHYAAFSQELLFLIALSWCFGLSSVLYLFGFSIEIGALLAGITLAGSQFHREIEARIRPLRDFFLIIFFIVLGTQISIDALSEIFVPSLLFSAFILIGNPLIVIAILRLFGYHPRTGFLTGVTMAQISEFSFIFIAATIGIGLIDASILPLATMVALMTIAGSTYLINYNEFLFEKFEFLFRWMEKVPDQKNKRGKPAYEILLFGFENMGMAILPSIKKLKKSFTIVDFNPQVIEELEEQKIECIYGDMGSQDFLEYIKAQKSKLIISTIPDIAASLDMIGYLKQKKSRASIIVTAKNPREAKLLYEAGATFVMIPNALGGEFFSHLLVKKKIRKQSWSALGKKSLKQMLI